MMDRYGTPSRPDDIPEAVWHSCWWAKSYGLQAAASRQIMTAKAEEREACANIADSKILGGYYDGTPVWADGNEIASAIRKRGESD